MHIIIVFFVHFVLDISSTFDFRAIGVVLLGWLQEGIPGELVRNVNGNFLKHLLSSYRVRRKTGQRALTSASEYQTESELDYYWCGVGGSPPNQMLMARKITQFDVVVLEL